MTRLEEVRREVERRLNELSVEFSPDVKLTFFMHHPTNPNCTLLVTAADPGEVLKALTYAVQGPSKPDREADQSTMIDRAWEGFQAACVAVMKEPENMAKPGWLNDTAVDLLVPITEKFIRLHQNAMMLEAGDREAVDFVKRDAVNIANFAMMIYDNAERRRLEERGREQ